MARKRRAFLASPKALRQAERIPERAADRAADPGGSQRRGSVPSARAYHKSRSRPCRRRTPPERAPVRLEGPPRIESGEGPARVAFAAKRAGGAARSVTADGAHPAHSQMAEREVVAHRVFGIETGERCRNLLGGLPGGVAPAGQPQEARDPKE